MVLPFHLHIHLSKGGMGGAVVIGGVVLCLEFFHHFFDYGTSSQFPLFAIAFGVAQVFIAGYAKDAAVTKLFGQRDNVEVEETKLSLLRTISCQE